MGDACRALNTPVTGGNCSLYNQSPAGPIDPTPTVGMVGLIDKAEHITTQWFKDAGDIIILLGEVVDGQDPLLGLGGSAYLQRIHGLKTGLPPRCDLDQARTLHEAVRSLIYGGRIKSAHDCSEGGLAVAVAECCLTHHVARETQSLIGAQLDLTSFEKKRVDALLFGETQSRVVVSTSAVHAAQVVAQAGILGVKATKIGVVGGDALVVKAAAGEWRWAVADLFDGWWNALARAMGS